MVVATRADKEDIVSMLTAAFLNNKSVNYIIAQTGKRKRINNLMSYSFEVCKMFGEVFISEDRQGCALILYPQDKRFSLRSLWLDLELIFGAIGIFNIRKALRRESAIKKIQPRVPMTYLWFIGVDPDHQHRGTGTKMMQDIVQMSKAENLPVFLETSAPENIAWYAKSGFEVYAELNLDYTLYFLRR